MAKPLLDDALWAIIEPFIPLRPRRFRYPGRKRVPDGACLTAPRSERVQTVESCLEPPCRPRVAVY